MADHSAAPGPGDMHGRRLPRANGAPGPGAPSLYPRQGEAAYGSEGDELDLQSLIRTLRRQWPVIVITLLVVLLAVGVYTFSQDPIFEAHSVVLVETSSSNRGGSGGMEELLSVTRGNRSLMNEVALLQQSVPLAERVAGRLLEERPGTPIARVSNGEQSQATIGQVARRMLNGQTRFETLSQGTDMIRIRATSTDPEEAAAMANTYAVEYSARSQEASRASVASSRAFLEDLENQQRRELNDIESNLQAFITREGAVALGSEAQNTVSQLAALDAQLEETRVELEIERTSLTSIEQEAERIHPGLTRRIASGTDREMGAVQEQIAELELRAGEYYAVNPDLRGNEIAEPELARIHRQIRQLRERMEELSDRYVQEVLAVGGLDGSGSGLGWATQLQRDAVQKRIRIQGLEAKSDVLRRQLGGYEERLRDLPRQSIQLAQLERQRAAVSDTYLYLVHKLQEARVAEQSQLGYIQVIRRADVPGGPVRPRPVRNMAMALALGLILGVGVALLRTSLDHRIRSTDDLREAGYPVLGSTPDLKALIQKNFDGKETIRIGNYEVNTTVAASLHPLSPLTEAMRQIRTAIRFSLPDQQIQTLVVTSAGPQEGKTTTAVNLAISMAKAGRRTLLVDGDLRRPMVHHRLGLGKDRGLTDLLFAAGRTDWEAYRYRLNVRWVGFDEEVNDLFVIPAGKSVANPAELLGSRRMRDLAAEMREHFDVIIFDAPPVLSITDPVLVANLCDATVLVARARETDERALERTAEQVAISQSPLLGVILNGYDHSEGGYGYGYGSGYSYTYGRGYGASDRFVVVGDGAVEPAEMKVRE